jgi:hypothetical protein
MGQLIDFPDSVKNWLTTITRWAHELQLLKINTQTTYANFTDLSMSYISLRETGITLAFRYYKLTLFLVNFIYEDTALYRSKENLEI